MEARTESAAVKAKAAKKKRPKKAAPSRAVVVRAPAPPPSNLLQVIAQATLDPRCDVAKMQALLDMQERLEERDAKKAFTAAFNALQAELPIVTKDGRIDHGEGVTAKGNKKLKTSFATYPNLNRVCGPLLKKHGFTFSSSVEPEPSGAMVITSALEHVAGASRSTRFRLTADTTGGKNNQQGWGSSQQYGMRYNMIALLNIVSEAKQDADGDGFSPGPDPGIITKKQADELTKLLKDAGASLDKFCAAFSIEALTELPVGDLEMAKSRIAAFKAERIRRGGDFPGDRPPL